MASIQRPGNYHTILVEGNWDKKAEKLMPNCYIIVEVYR